MVANPAFYLDEFTDEVLPSGLADCTLAGWAAWLAKGGEDAPDGEDGGCWTFEPPADGTSYKASSLKFLDDIEIERLPDGDDEPRFRWSRPFDDGADFAAIRYGAGLGWSADDIICDAGSQHAIEAELADLAWPKMDVGETALLAVARHADLKLIYRADPPRLELAQ